MTFIFPLCGCDAQSKSISVEELDNILEKDSSVVLVDVRNENEFTGKMSMIPSAINIPLTELESRINELEEYKNQPVYIICRSGNRSGFAAKILSAKGFDAYNVTGGMLDYSKKFRSDE